MLNNLSLNFLQVPAKKTAKDFDDLFDDDDDRLMDEGLSDTNSPAKKPVPEDEEDDDFLMPATGRVRNRGAFLDDESSLGELQRFRSWFSVFNPIQSHVIHH